MLRTVTHLSLAVLLAVSLLWGGCLSCGQFWMTPIQAKACCDPAGHCKKSSTAPATPQECHIQAVELSDAGSAAVGSALLTSLVFVGASSSPTLPLHSLAASPLPTVPGDDPPLDLCLLHSLLRI